VDGYSVANWLMTGSEKVIGVLVEVNTESMNIPEWASYAEASNEVWARFQSSGYWVEMGTLAGRDYSCCSLTWFHAWENGSGFTGVFFEGSITLNTWPYYWMVAAGNGEWCWEIGLHGEATVDCKGGFSTYSNWLTDGMEVASETEPTDVGKVVTSYEALDGSWHTWKKAENEHEEQTCISQFGSYPGNINYSTC
jgi:hypothetical protein